jgi:phosphatidylglycerol lysyltransferase
VEACTAPMADTSADAVEDVSVARARFLRLVRAQGADAVAFQGLAASMQIWFDDADAEGGAAVAYFDTGRAWVAAGGPVSTPAQRGEIARRFVEAGRRADRRVAFFGVEGLNGFGGWQRLHLGEQPSASPNEWLAAVKGSRTLKEQLRRARAKGVHADPTPATALAPTTPLRLRVDRLLARWLASRRIEPMSFLVLTDPYVLREAHTYVVADHDGRVVGLLSAVPAYGDHGWLVEHLVCARDSPNGTAETLLDALHRSLIAQGRGDDRVSLGLAPLSSPTGGTTAGSAWQKLARAFARPLFDFEGLHRFKARLRPSEWRSVWLVVPHGASLFIALVDALTAFAGGSLVRFAARSLLVRPRGLLWLLAVGLVPWTALLLWLDVTNAEGVAGYSRGALAWWIAFDVVLATGLFRAALRPSYRVLVTLIVAALADSFLSSLHLHAVGFGPAPADSVLRVAAVIAPAVGATTLFFITFQRAREIARSRTPPQALS